MNTYPALTNIRTQLSHMFFTLRTNALRDSLWARLTGKTTRLTVFPCEEPERHLDRKYIGIREIPIGQIVGTTSRQDDFDHKFRPLNKRLRTPWVNVYLTLARDGWLPILVHKVGNAYFVGDGHLRLSIAQALGITAIDARVWDYPTNHLGQQEYPIELCLEKSSIEV